VVHPSILSVKDQAIPSLAAGETYKYLGIRVGTSRQNERRELYSACTESIRKWLQNISSAPLKPQQRMKILRTHLLPRLTHSLVLGDPTKTLLVRLDVLVRRAVSRWLHLPHSSPKGLFHACSKSGGLNIPSFLEIHELRKRRLRQFMRYEDSVSHWLLHESRWGEHNFGFLRSGRVQSLNRSSTLDQRVPPRVKSWEEKLHESADGCGLIHHNLVPKAHAWVLSDSVELVSGAEYVRGTLLRGNFVATPSRKHRIDRDHSDKCSTCGPNHTATLGHILQTCSRSHGPRIKRHNYVAKYVSERLRRLGFSVLEEPIIPYHQTFRKPDLVAWRGDQAIVCDVAITGDGWDPDRAHQEKIRYYDCLEIRQWCRGLCEEATWQFGNATLN